MLSRLLIPSLVAALALTSFVPASSAEAGPVSCGADTDFLTFVNYHCTVGGIGPSGSVSGCPSHVCWSNLYCSAEASPLSVGCNFP